MSAENVRRHFTDTVDLDFYSGVTKQGFEGCIENLALQLATWDLNLNKKAKGVSPGCPEQVGYR